MKALVACGVWLVACMGAFAQTTRPSLFNPSRHMHVSEIHAGMKGYGLSVFKGTRIERFNVEVVSVLRNFNPKYDVILVKMAGADLEHTGSIAGMSGSPIFLKDDQGRERMAGAFAYGWPMTKDPIGGVQPIEYMLELQEGKGDGGDGKVVEGQDGGTAKPAGRGRWSLDEVMEWGKKDQAEQFWRRWAVGQAQEPMTGIRPLATPLMVSGLSPQLMNDFGTVLRGQGLEMLQAGGNSSGGAPTGEPVKLEPGSTLAISLMSGDLNLTAIGTVTEVIGDRVFGFGHAMQNEGTVKLPMGSGRVNGIIPNMMTSFKIGEVAQVNGTLGVDQVVGVAGRVGPKAPTVPIDLHLAYTDGSMDRRFHYDAAVHPKWTPMLSAIAVSASLTGGRELPQYNTVDYDLDMEFEGGQKVKLADTLVNTSAAEVFFVIGLPMVAAAENPFARVAPKSVSGELRVSTGARQAEILSVNVPKEKYKPGDTLKAWVTYRPFRQDEAVMPVQMDLPKDLPEGAYQLRISGWEAYLDDEHQTRPFRFTAESTGEMFDALREVAAVKRTNVYLRLLRQADGVSVGRVAMPALPGSRRQVMLESGWSNVSPFVSSNTKAVPTKYVMDGSADFQIVIEHDVRGVKKVEGKGATLPPRTPQPGTGALPGAKAGGHDQPGGPAGP